jgi:hypothetical protein
VVSCEHLREAKVCGGFHNRASVRARVSVYFCVSVFVREEGHGGKL